MTVSHMKVTDTLNRPLRDLRISVTDRCNFRCPYCMPKEVFGRDWAFLPRAHLLSFEELVRLARIFVDHGIEKIRLTGGEPLVSIPFITRSVQQRFLSNPLKLLPFSLALRPVPEKACSHFASNPNFWQFFHKFQRSARAASLSFPIVLNITDNLSFFQTQGPWA